MSRNNDNPTDGDQDGGGSSAPTTDQTAGVSFVNFNHPSEFLSSSARRVVRSHVTRRQHQITRSARDARAARPRNVQLARLAPREAVPPIPSENSRSGNEPLRPLLASGVRSSNESSPLQEQRPLTIQPVICTRPMMVTSASNVQRLAANMQEPNMQSSASINPETVTSTATSRAHQVTYSPGSPRLSKQLARAIRNFEQKMRIERAQSTNQSEPIITISAPPSSDRHLLFEAMHSFMFENFGKPMWSRLGISDSDGQLWESTLYRLSQTEPALLFARMLFAAGHLSKLNILDPGICAWIYERAVALVYEALTVESRKLSEALIIAIGRLALYEGFFGTSRYAHEVHRPAQYRLIESRGGMANLRLPTISKHFLTWGDEMLANQSGTESLLGKHMSGAPTSLSRDQAMETLRTYYPFQYANLLRIYTQTEVEREDVEEEEDDDDNNEDDDEDGADEASSSLSTSTQPGLPSR